MIVAIHQPEFMPWLGFFDKMHKADKYVVFDHVQFKKRYFENRNRIKCGNEAVWVTLPVKSKGKYLQRINEVEIENSIPWQRKIWESIRHCYTNSNYLNDYSQELETLLLTDRYEMLMDFNLAFIEWFRKVLNINTPTVFSSKLGVEDYSGSGLILEICRKLGANQYLCGPSGKDYLNIDDFEKEGIEIIWQDFKHPSYHQNGTEFIPYLSTLDLIVNCGQNSTNILLGRNI